jgi:hypothetical protein
MKTALQIVYTLLCIMIGFFFGGQTERNKPEKEHVVFSYTIDFLDDEETVHVINEENKIYSTTFERIEETITRDNQPHPTNSKTKWKRTK